ncbi:accessory factor UbiK family protein [Camelimonas abortus]|uniref:Accessory factor UbiK family protein n=1 Tax=Camelimonas abortus TaxID=1017184 RepID=A0ABV7LAU0_9HYPH
MSIGPNRLLDELSRLATDAIGAAQGVRREAAAVARGQLDRLTQTLDMVSREEFEAVRDMAIAAREENDRLNARVAKLEAALAALTGDLAAGDGAPESRASGDAA